MTVLQLFRRGRDTLQIAKHMRKSEAEVLRMLHILRSHEKRRKARFGSLDGRK